METMVTLSVRTREPEVSASTVKVARLEITAFHSQGNREVGVRP
jgi:hypothetical protein